MSSVMVQPAPRSHEEVRFNIPRFKYRDRNKRTKSRYPKWSLTHEPVQYPKNATKIVPMWREKGRLVDQVRKAIEGRWATLKELSQRTGASEASVSAAIRSLRHPMYGSYPVIRRYLGLTRHGGVWEYTIPIGWE